MVDSIAPQRSLTLPGLTAGLGVLVAIVLGYGWWSTGQNVTALDKRTATLESSAGGTASAADLQKLQLEQADLAKKLDAVAPPDVSGLTGDVAALKTAVGDLTSKIGDTPAKLGALETRIAAIEARAPADLTQVTSDLAEVKTGLAALKTQIGDTPAKLGALETRIAAIEARAPADLTQVTADLAEVKTGLAALKTQIGDFAPATLTALAAQVSDLAGKIPAADDNGQLATAVAALGGQIDTLRTQVGDVSADKIATLQGSVDGLATKMATLSSDIGAAASASDLSALQTKLNEFAKTMPPATNIEPLVADVGSLKTRVATLETSGTADSATVAALGAQLDGLTARMGAVETTNPAADVAAIKTDLAGLRSEIGALAKSADVATLQAAVKDLQLKPRTAVTQPKVLAQIYFDRGSYKLVEASTQTLEALAKDLLANPRDVAIMGFSDTQGPVEFNRTLSLRRASAVRKALIGLGIDTSMVTALTGLGEDGPPVVTDDGTPERGNRTVLVLANN